jgi:hypothetical protein
MFEVRGTFDGEGELVHITPPPVLPRLEGLDQRMTRFVEVGGGVMPRRTVAAPNMATEHAHPEVQPPASDPKAVLTTIRGRYDLLDLGQVIAELFGISHVVSSDGEVVRPIRMHRWYR